MKTLFMPFHGVLNRRSSQNCLGQHRLIGLFFSSMCASTVRLSIVSRIIQLQKNPKHLLQCPNTRATIQTRGGQTGGSGHPPKRDHPRGRVLVGMWGWCMGSARSARGGGGRWGEVGVLVWCSLLIRIAAREPGREENLAPSHFTKPSLNPINPKPNRKRVHQPGCVAGGTPHTIALIQNKYGGMVQKVWNTPQGRPSVMGAHV